VQSKLAEKPVYAVQKMTGIANGEMAFYQIHIDLFKKKYTIQQAETNNASLMNLKYS